MKAEKDLETERQELSEDGNIDKIRDILFGVQVRDFELRFSKLEEKFGKEVEGLRIETREKLDKLNKLEEFLSKEFNTLTDKIYEEQDLRGDAIRKLSDEMQNAARELEKQITNLAETTTKNESDIRTQILDQSRTIIDSIQKKQDDVMALMERETKELRDDKTDRAALAELFAEMAMRLNGEFKIPDSE